MCQIRWNHQKHPVAHRHDDLIHNDKLVIPYAISDQLTTFALVSLPELLAELTG